MMRSSYLGEKHLKNKIVVVLMGCIIAVSVWGAAKQPQHTKQWRQKMQQMSQLLTELMPVLVSEQKFNDPANAAHIQKNARQLAALAHTIQPSATLHSPDADPSVPIMAQLFDQQAAKALKELNSGHRDYSRSLLRSTVSYCMACHTRGVASNVPVVSITPDTQSLSKYEKAALFAAIRDFDQAYKEFNSIAGDEALAREDPLQWEKAARTGMAIAIRIQQNPEHAESIVKRILVMPTAPAATKTNATLWMESINEWQKEDRPKVITADFLYRHAKSLMRRADSAQQYPTDHSADVVFLRAILDIHQLLRLDPKGPHTAEALYWAGYAYNALHDLNLWTLHELYYQACIRTKPHSGVAKKAYKEYNKSIRDNYTGSGGIEIPQDVAKHLQELHNLAY